MNLDIVMQFDVNLLAVLVAGLAYFMIGGLWYSPALFAKAWVAATGKTDAEIREGMKGRVGLAYVGSVVGAIVAALILANLVRAMSITKGYDGAQLGFFCWVGLSVGATISGAMFEGRSKNLYLINQGYQLAGFMAMGAILAAWK